MPVQIASLQPRRATILALVAVFWAVVFLPGLGTIEIEGEEGRRLLPGITMVESGDWIVPRIGGEIYQRKPPLINWMAAASFKLTGVVNEWTGRLPSAIAVLGLGLSVAALTFGFLGPWGALFAAIFTLTNISMVEKGRLAEIEAIYMVCTGMAILWWSTAWLRRSSAWITWLPAGFFLGLGWLAKGPIIMVFFYAAVLPTLALARRQGMGRPVWRELLGPSHLVGFSLMLAIFGSWAIANLRATAGEDTGAIWIEQFTSRIGGNDNGGGGFDFIDWARQFPRAAINFLPWLVFLPLLWRRSIVDSMPERTRVLFLGLRRGMVLAFLIVLIPPGSSSRFVMPLLIVPALLLATAFAHAGPHLPGWLPSAWRRTLLVLAFVLLPASLAIAPAGFFSATSIAAALIAFVLALAVILWRRHLVHPHPLMLASMAVITTGILIYAGGVMPRLPPHDDVRPIARELRDMLPKDEPVYAINPEFQPVFFYIDTPLVQVESRHQVPTSARLVLVREEKLEGSIPNDRSVAGPPLMRVAEKGRDPLLLLELAPADQTVTP